MGPLRLLASAGMATVVIAASTVVLVWAIWIDAKYGLEVARFAVYDAWWFAGLLALLGVNVLAAAVVRFPWKRKQVGFLLVHAGILVLLVGCWLSARDGVDAELWVFEGDRSSTAVTTDQEFTLTIDGSPRPLTGEGSGVRATFKLPFHPGPFNWSDYPGLCYFPWHLPRRDRGVLFARDGVTVEVLDYCSDSTRQPVPSVELRASRSRSARSDDATAWQPVRLAVRELVSPHDPDRSIWIGSRRDFTDGGVIVFRASSGKEETAAFLDSQPEGSLGRLGQVVLHVGGKKHHFLVEDLQGKATPLGDSGLTVELGSMDPDHLVVQLLVRGKQEEDRPEVLFLNALRTDLDRHATRHGVFGCYCVGTSDKGPGGTDEIPAEALRQAARPRIDLLASPDGKLHYRAWRAGRFESFGELPVHGASPNGSGATPDEIGGTAGLPSSVVGTAGQADSGTRAITAFAESGKPITLVVDAFTPANAPGATVQPVPFAMKQGRQPRARVRLTVDGRSRECWLANRAVAAATDERSARLTVGDRTVSLELAYRAIDLGFEVALKEFRRELDPGTARPSRYWSLVDIVEKADPACVSEGPAVATARDVLVELNAPCSVTDPATGRTYRMFQSSYHGPYAPGDPEFDQIVGGSRKADELYRSVFSVAFDPGRAWKYAGCLMIVAGIAVMYYMKAYFFERRGTKSL